MLRGIRWWAWIPSCIRVSMSDSPPIPMEKPSVDQFESPPMAPRDEKIADHEATAATPSAFPSVDEAAVLRKMDVRLIPMLSILYLLAFLDRGNIGNAKIEGLVKDMHMTEPQFNWTCMAGLLWWLIHGSNGLTDPNSAPQ